MDNQVIEVYISATSCRQNGATTNSLARVNSRNVTNADYQPLLNTSVTVIGALLASLGGCTVLGMSLGLNVSIMEPGSRGTAGADLGLLQWWGCSSNARSARKKFWATPT